tara:strand:- start:158 stop:520 length:363 start_codon:yes stop_codon:yes gene_type:complete
MYQINDDNFFIFAMKHYDNPNCKGMDEFKDDLKRFSYVKRLLKKLKAGDGLKERLIINHLIILYNLFGSKATTQMLFFKIDEKYKNKLKSFLIFLNVMPFDNMEIIPDQNVLESLRKING